MTRSSGPSAAYDTGLMLSDAAEMGWSVSKLADRLQAVADEPPPSRATVYRFFRGFQTAPVAKAIADALGHPVSRYLRITAAVSQ